MKYAIIAALFFLVCCSQVDSTRLNTKPARGILFLEQEPQLYWLISSNMERVVIQRHKYFEISIDEYGAVVNASNDTIAQSCELMEAIVFMLDSCVVAKSPVTDSAYYYKEQVEFYRQWFKRNDTPNPLSPKQQFKSN